MFAQTSSSPALPRRKAAEDLDPVRFEMFEVGPILDGSEARTESISKRVAKLADEMSNQGIPLPK